jgi:hypothetical protein
MELVYVLSGSSCFGFPWFFFQYCTNHTERFFEIEVKKSLFIKSNMSIISMFKQKKITHHLLGKQDYLL